MRAEQKREKKRCGSIWKQETGRTKTEVRKQRNRMVKSGERESKRGKAKGR
jgi:hypothetical protein